MVRKVAETLLAYVVNSCVEERVVLYYPVTTNHKNFTA